MDMNDIKNELIKIIEAINEDRICIYSFQVSMNVHYMKNSLQIEYDICKKG